MSDLPLINTAHMTREVTESDVFFGCTYQTTSDMIAAGYTCDLSNICIAYKIL